MKFSPSIEIAPVDDQVKERPKLIWPSQRSLRDEYGFGEPRFPVFEEYVARYKDPEPKAAIEFVRSVRAARHRVWLMDDYIFKDDNQNLERNVLRVLSWFKGCASCSDIRIATRCFTYECRTTIDSLVYDFVEDMNRARGSAPSLISVEVGYVLCRGRFDFLHDRFAIIDDELWHFGATVGGLHSKVSAVSHGWHAEQRRASSFFEEAWRQR